MNKYLSSRAVIFYIAIALIGTGVYEDKPDRVGLGVGLLMPNAAPIVDQRLGEANARSRRIPRKKDQPN